MVLRSARERLLQTVLYELGGLLLVTPLYGIVTGHTAAEAMFLLIAVSIATMSWAAFHNTVFDYFEQKHTGRVASDRPQALRFVHAASTEVTSVIVTTPVIMAIGKYGFWDALLVDIGLTLIYSAYAYLFHIAFDFIRPIQIPQLSPVLSILGVQHIDHLPNRLQHTPAPVETHLFRAGQFGVHIMVDGYRAPFRLLNDQVYLRGLLFDLPRLIGMHAIAEPQLVRVDPVSHENPGGLCGSVMTAESHFSFHTFPSRRFVTMDLYTCQGEFDRDGAVDLLKRAFHILDANVFIQDRGLRVPVYDVAGQERVSGTALAV